MASQTKMFAAIKDLTEPSTIKCCSADELYELKPGMRYSTCDFSTKKFTPKKDYGRIKSSGGVQYMHKVWILDIDSEEILRAKKAAGKIRNIARGKGIGNERVLLSKYQLQEEKDSVASQKKVTECSSTSSIKEVGESIMTEYSRIVRKVNIKNVDEASKRSAAPKRAAAMTEQPEAVQESSSTMVLPPSPKVSKLADKEGLLANRPAQNVHASQPLTEEVFCDQPARKEVCASVTASEAFGEPVYDHNVAPEQANNSMDELADLFPTLQSKCPNCTVLWREQKEMLIRMESKIDRIAADIGLRFAEQRERAEATESKLENMQSLLSSLGSKPVVVPVAASSGIQRRRLTIPNAVIGAEEVKTFLKLVDGEWVAVDISDDEIYCGDGRIIRRDEAEKIVFRRLDTLQTKINGLAALIFKGDLQYYWLSKPKNEMKQYPEDCIEAIRNMINEANRKMSKSSEVIIDLEINAIREKLKHTTLKAKKGKVTSENPNSSGLKKEAEENVEEITDGNGNPVRSPSDM